MLFLDSVMDNLLPAARPFLLTVYQNKEAADVAWEVMVSSRIYGLAFGCFVSIFMSRRHGRKFPVVLGLEGFQRAYGQGSDLLPDKLRPAQIILERAVS
ncbi:hypothetical protein ANCCAN_11847 [Ancylostoma caninum]|uniref:Uncharacterized protein n=1 Tax=Ancylostoma caninum TaxID=29170 RepID=A0A368GGJ5_ANCCA|nr:hypothetical protein ANCCAN_11847 [Ancylostoma caninum]